MTDITQGQLAQMVSGCTKLSARDVPDCHGMTDSLRTLIEATLAQARGLCLDNPADRAALAGLLLGALRPLDIEQHPTALEAELDRLYEERDAALAKLAAAEPVEPVLILQVNCWMRWDDVHPSVDAYHGSVYAAVDRALTDYDHVWVWRVVDRDGHQVAAFDDAWVADRRQTLRGPQARNQDGDGPYPVQPAPLEAPEARP